MSQNFIMLKLSNIRQAIIDSQLRPEDGMKKLNEKDIIFATKARLVINTTIIQPILLSNQSAPVAPGDFKIKIHIRTAARHTSLLTK